jgi:Mg-chelatase subunit ChlD
MEIKALADRAFIRSGSESVRYIAVELTAPAAPAKRERSPLNLAVVLDRSGSMGGDKIARAREAALQVVRTLGERDVFAVVAYDDRIDVVAPSDRATPEGKARAAEGIAHLDARGSTNLCEGWLRGCQQVGERLHDEEIGRCFLLTDGLANAGITDHDEIVRHATELRRRRVSTSTFGVGSDFDERLLRRLAEAGGGNFYYIEQARQIPDFIASELGEALEVVARDVELALTVGDGVSVRCLNEFPVTHAGGVARVEIGPLVSGQAVTLALRLEFPRGRSGTTQEMTLKLRDRDRVLKSKRQTFVFTYGSHARNDGQQRDVWVDRKVATAYANLAIREALECNKRGEFEGARRAIEKCVERIRVYAGGDAELLRIIADLEGRIPRYGVHVMDAARRGEYFQAVSSLRSRDVLGRARSRHDS